ncbi:TetR/AcrR family transcriptional regulator [Lewinella cohaerens]|uniref:TetR/AcrR family transcriptional regulator n=1 Tax=Lewinella cohaerens TaxID=70995 RepID=UPI0003A71787|nr:TetR/AcrR family transcriptional regulator [Lewinella cohaerens]
MANTITDRQFEIIGAAGKILTNAGVGGLTIKNLAKEMQFSESAVYRHFSSKEKIILAMLDFLASNMDERYTEILSIERKTEEKFITLFQNQFTFFDSNPHFVVAVFSDGLMEESQSVNESISKIMQVKMKHLKPIILEGQENKLFTDAISADNIMHIIMGSMRLQMYKWRVANFQFDILHKGEEIIQSLLTIIKK